MKQIAVKKFTSELVLEYSSTPIPVELGTFENEMTLYLSESGEKGFIEWYYYNDKEDGCEEIGLWFENGQYVITVQQGDEQARNNSVTFQLAGEAPKIPEFGPIAALVLAIAIISIIAVSAKTGLRFMPKY